MAAACRARGALCHAVRHIHKAGKGGVHRDAIFPNAPTPAHPCPSTPLPQHTPVRHTRCDLFPPAGGRLLGHLLPGAPAHRLWLQGPHHPPLAAHRVGGAAGAAGLGLLVCVLVRGLKSTTLFSAVRLSRRSAPLHHARGVAGAVHGLQGRAVQGGPAQHQPAVRPAQPYCTRINGPAVPPTPAHTRRPPLPHPLNRLTHTRAHALRLPLSTPPSSPPPQRGQVHGAQGAHVVSALRALLRRRPPAAELLRRQDGQGERLEGRRGQGGRRGEGGGGIDRGLP